jgi:integrase
MGKKQSEIKYYINDEVAAICNECVRTYSNGKQIYRLGHAIILLIYTGMRIGELLGLQWKDISFNDRTVKIKSAVVTVKNRDKDAKVKYVLLHQESVKTEAGNRIIYLNNKALDALRELEKINGKSNYVMASVNGTIAIPRNITRMLDNVLTRCNLPCYGVHSLRHTYASMLFRKGVDVKTVSELLGHANVTITYNTYIHLIKEQKQQAVNLLDEID